MATRHSLSSPHAAFSGDAASLPAGRLTSYGEPFEVPFDKLVIAVGAYSQTFGIPGYAFYFDFSYCLGCDMRNTESCADGCGIWQREGTCSFLEGREGCARHPNADIGM